MNPLSKAISMILRGDFDKFKTILQEALEDRAGLVLQEIYKESSKTILSEYQVVQESLKTELSVNSTNTPEIPSSFTTKDGIHVTLTPEQITGIIKLYENLNNNSKERLLKLLTESEEAVNRILNLTKIERKSNVK